MRKMIKVESGSFAALVRSYKKSLNMLYHALFIAIIQQNLASDMLGRTFSLIFSLSTFPSMLGIVASGYWVEAWGITSVFMISGWVIFLIGVGANFISSIKQLDNYA